MTNTTDAQGSGQQTQIVGQQLLSFLKSDAVNTFGPPVATFLQAEIAANGDVAKIGVAAFVGYAQIVAAAPTALAGLEGELGQFFLGRIQAAEAANKAKPLT